MPPRSAPGRRLPAAVVVLERRVVAQVRRELVEAPRQPLGQVGLGNVGSPHRRGELPVRVHWPGLPTPARTQTCRRRRRYHGRDARAPPAGPVRVRGRPRPVSAPGRGGVAFLVAAAVLLVIIARGTFPAPLYPLWQRAYGFGSLTVTEVFAPYACGTLTALLVVGRASDQAGRRPVLIGGLLMTELPTAHFLAAPGTAWLYLRRVTSGLAVGIATGAAAAARAELEPRQDPRRAAAYVTGASMGGLGLGSLAAGVLAEYAPHPTRLVFAAYLAVVAVAAA